MTRLISTVVLMALFVGADPRAARAHDFEQYMPDKSQVLLYFGIRQVIQSKIVQRFSPPEKEGTPPSPTVKGFQEKFGLNLFTDIHYFAIFAPSATKSQELVAGVIGGTFKPDRFLEGMQWLVAHSDGVFTEVKDGDRVAYKVTTQTFAGPQTVYFTLVDSGHIVLGLSVEAMHRCIANAAQPARPDAQGDGMKNLLANIGDDTAMVLYADASEDHGFNGRAVTDPRVAGLLDKGKSMTAMLTMDAAIKFSMALTMADADAAKELKPTVVTLLRQVVDPFVNIIVSSDPKLKPLKTIAQSIKVSTEGEKIIVSLELTAENIEAFKEASAGPDKKGEK